MKKVIIEAGHGDPGTGASYWGITERELTLAIGNAVYDRLSNIDDLEEPIGFLDNYRSLQQKIGHINRICDEEGLDYKNSILISIHINAGGGTGIETFTYKDFKEGLNLGNTLLLEIQKSTGMRIRGAKFENESQYSQLGIVHDTKPLACLIECGFIDVDWNKQNKEKLISKFAQGIVNGILKYVGVEQNEEKLTRGELQYSLMIKEIQEVVDKNKLYFNKR